MSNKEYKCIKNYPGVKVGTIAKEAAHEPAGWFKITHNGSFLFNKKEDYFDPEFWEEVVEKDWEILEGITSVKVSLTAENISQIIYKVKRLSDNTTFSLGDKVKHMDSVSMTPEKINKIELKDGAPHFFTQSFENNGIDIFKIKKCERVFTAEDKVDIFNGDNYWFVVKSNFVGVNPWTPISHTCNWNYTGGINRPALGYVQFSTKKAAEDWIDLNKPIYSKSDVFRAKSGESKFPNHFCINFDKLKSSI